MREEMSGIRKVLWLLIILGISFLFALAILIILLFFTPAILSEIFRKRREKIEEAKKILEGRRKENDRN